jgi:hypothetical protein
VFCHGVVVLVEMVLQYFIFLLGQHMVAVLVAVLVDLQRLEVTEGMGLMELLV